MKWLVLKKLASCLRLRVPAKNLPTPSVVCNIEDNSDARDLQHSDQQLQEMASGTTDKLLMEIRDLLQINIRSKAEDTNKPNEDNKTKRDWKLAAAVIDRILLIIFVILVFGGSIVFFITFAVLFHPDF